MTKKQLAELEAEVMKEVVRRRGLGGYNSEAESILLLSEFILKIVRHLEDKAPNTKQ